ncbi:MAG: sigma-70 family RNA polymerase sigma factor [Pirellulales bacterium]
MNGPTDDGASDGGSIGAKLLGRLLDQHGPALALYAAQWTDAADDCVQEALVELARQRQVPVNVRAWLFRVVKNRALNAARGARRRREREDRAAQIRLVAGRSATIDHLDILVVAEALESLEPIERGLIVMRIWGGLTFGEIAETLASSTSSIHRQYQQALETLRQKLESPCTTNKSSKSTRSPRN